MCSVVLIFSATVVAPLAAPASTLELAGTVGFPWEDGVETSYGLTGVYVFTHPEPVELGLAYARYRFGNEANEGSVLWRTIGADLRLYFLPERRVEAFGVFGIGFAGITCYFSEAAQASNDLIPSSQSSLHFLTVLGTGQSMLLAGKSLRLVSTQKIHFVGEKTFLVVSLGLRFSM
jgi:hypothetical protein